MIKTGAMVVLEESKKYLSLGNIGLITNTTGVTSELESLIDVFHLHPEIKLKAVFGPEHGAKGDLQDALPVENYIDKVTGLPVYSLYGDNKKPSVEMIDGLDELFFDIQDVGTRFYTYVSTLTLCMEVAKEQGLKFTVLDRPNPINGLNIEGNVLEDSFKSFIGLHPIPIRHGMTIGELALFINEKIKAELNVVNMHGWTRDMWYDETGLPWVQPSPNIPSLDTAIVYLGTCFFEGVSVSEGRGTTRPFEYLGAPWVNAVKWAKEMNGKMRARRYKNQRCEGLQVHVTQREVFEPVATGLHLLTSLIKQHPSKLFFNPPSYGVHPHFDYLAGSSQLREDLTNDVSVEEIIDKWRDEIINFIKIREKHLLYVETY